MRSARLKPGDELGRLVVEQVLGRGAQSEVYRVRHASTGQRLAVKLLLHADLRDRVRMEREVRSLLALRHRHVIRCFGYVPEAPRPAMLLELVDGADLTAWLLAGRAQETTLAARVALFWQIVEGVQAAHALGLVHRDLKPQNVLLAGHSDRPVAKVADFGMVKALGEDAFSRHLTRSGAMMGTLGFMAPEQSRDVKRVDHRADLFSLGAILYALLCGRPACSGHNIAEVLGRTARADYVAPHHWAPGLPRDLEALVHEMLSPDPAGRPADTAEVLLRLKASDLPDVRPKAGGEVGDGETAQRGAGETMVPWGTAT